MEWLKIQYEQNPEALCINNWTFKEVYIKVISLARKLNRCVEQEPRIGLLMENSPESVLLLYALLLLKKEVLMLNIRLTEKEIHDQTEKLNIKTVISSKNQYLDFEDITRLPEQEIELDWETDEEQIAVIMNTSATTGSFKSVP
ncbi:AMP-binding protein, partial [Coprococcus sp. CLA-AA-H190]